MGENNDADAEKFAILYFLHSFVLSNVETVVIPRLNFDLADSGRYKGFSWGSLSFEDLAKSLNNRLKAGGQFYLIQGMPLAIQVWLYEYYSNVPSKIALKVDNRIPQLLNWKTISPRPHFEFVMNAMFNGNGKVVFKNIEPTKKELSKLQIPQKDATQHERSVDFDDDFQDPPLRKSNEHSKKKQKVDSSTPVVKKPLRKKQVDSFEEHTQMRTPAPRAAKANGMKTPIFKPISIRQTSSKTAKEKQTAQVIFPQVHSKPDIHVEEVTVSKPESHVDKQAFISKKDFDAFHDEVEDIEADKAANVDEGGLEQSGQYFNPNVVQSPDNIFNGTKQQHADKDPEVQNMDYVVTEKSPQQLSLEVDQELEANLLDKKGCTILRYEKMNVEIDSQQLIPDELLQNINLDYLHSEKVVQHDCQHIDVCFYCLRKKSKYGPHSSYKNEPNKSYKYSTVDCNCMNVIRSLNDVYSMDAQNLKDGGQEHHLMEYINDFRMHTAVPWHTVEEIFIPVNIKEKHHWVLAILLFSERCIFLYDSYESSGHYAAVLAEIEKIAKIIPLCLQACDFYVKEGIDHQRHPRYKDKESSYMFDVLFQDDLPQQPSESLDYGVFMVMYAEWLSYGHKVIASEFDPNALRTRYAALLWDYGIRK
ncbi:hypothetical protein FXO38_12327 [Capsicum annuum]|nr:hypothetical protein FXO38_12327 [Capsicum annuum]